MYAIMAIQPKSTIGGLSNCESLATRVFQRLKSKMNVKMTSFLENYSKNSFGLPNRAWKAALGKGFQGLLLQQRLLRAI